MVRAVVMREGGDAIGGRVRETYPRLQFRGKNVRGGIIGVFLCLYISGLRREKRGVGVYCIGLRRDVGAVVSILAKLVYFVYIY